MNRRTPEVWRWLLAAVLCAGCSAWPEARYDAVDRAAHPDADGVVLLDEGRLTFEGGSEPAFVFRRHTRIKVLTPRGRRHAEVVIPLDAWTTLEAFAARSFGPDGRDADESRDAEVIYDVPARPDAGVLYSDVRIARSLVPGVDVGDVLEYRSTVRSTRMFALPGWVFEADIPVVQSRLLISKRVPARVRWSFARRGRIEAITPTPHTDRDGDWLAFERRDLGVFEPEPYGPPPAEQVERLRLLIESDPASRSWDGLAAWYRGLMAPRLSLPPRAEAAAHAAVADRPPAERLAWVDTFVRRRIRYVATHVGIGAFQPNPVEAVLAHGYGDCKDMVSLYVALGRSLDLEVYPVLVGTRGHGVPDPALPTVSAFDHVIAAARIDDTWIYADPTDSDGALGEVPPSIAGRPGLRIGPAESAQVVLPMPAADADQAEVTWRFEGGDRLRLDARFVGRTARVWRTADPGRDAMERLVRQIFFDGDSTAEIETVAATEQTGHTRVVVEARWPGIWTGLDGQTEGLALHRFIGRSAEIRVAAERESAVHLGPPRARVIRLDLPWAASTDDILPPASAEESPLGSSRWTVEAAEGRLKLAFDLRFETPRVDAEALPKLRALMEHAAQVGRGMVIRRAGER